MINIERERRARFVESRLTHFAGLLPEQRQALSVPLMRRGWQVLIPRQRRSANEPDAYVVGSSGVFALAFADVLPERAQLLRLRARAEELCAGITVGRRVFVGHMVNVVIVLPPGGERHAEDSYSSTDVKHLDDVLRTGSGLPNHEAVAAAIVGRGSFVALSGDEMPEADVGSAEELFAESDLLDAERRHALGREFEDWIVYLDPEQRDLVERNFTGPARISGPAGTGKTVVALHRMARSAKYGKGRILFTTFVKTLPGYHKSGYDRLTRGTGDRTEFVGLDKWTLSFLTRRGISPTVTDGITAFNLAWRKAREQLSVICDDVRYWQDEIHRLIKGREVTTLQQYQEKGRRGRHIGLSAEQRELVWRTLYEPYRRHLAERGLHDFTDLALEAIAQLTRQPLDEPYDLVGVDEVQDFTLVQLRLAHLIAGGGDKAPLLLIGDGQQQVYPGGWRLSEAGIPIVGRGAVLRVNYRNRQAVHDWLRRVEAANTVDDLDGGKGYVLAESEVVLPGGTAEDLTLPPDQVGAALVTAIDRCPVPSSGIAVITAGHREADQVRRALENARIQTIDLTNFDGTPSDRIKVGTVHRAKGMQFPAVFVVMDNPATADDRELAARQLLTAAGRARDHLWVCYIRH
jgi:hypothetical protein